MSYFFVKPTNDYSFLKPDDRFGEPSVWYSDHYEIMSCRVDDPVYWSPSEENGIYCLISGRIAFSREEWIRAESLDGTGGLATRLMLDYWNNRRKDIYSLINGAGIVLICEGEQLHLITDRLGFMPVYMSEIGTFLSSHSDVLASHLNMEGQSLTLNKGCLSEFLAYGSSLANDTYFNEISLLKNGNHYVFNHDSDTARVKSSEYWRPEQNDIFHRKSPSKKGEELAKAIINATKLRAHDFLGDTGIMLSSGVDSRSLLFSLEDPKASHCFTIYESENDELHYAQEIAKRIPAEHTLIKRDAEYYAYYARDIVSVSGGRFSLIDGHYIGMADQIRNSNIGCLLTGCYCDYMFKGLSQNKVSYNIFGKFIPFFRRSKFELTSYTDPEILSDKWQAIVDTRRLRAYGSISEDISDIDRQNHELVRNLPFSREADSAGRNILRLMFPYDCVFADTGVINNYLSLSVDDKLNGMVFEKAVRYLASLHGAHVKNNNYKSPVGISISIRILYFLRGVLKRKIGNVLGLTSAGNQISEGTWPTWDKYFSSSENMKKLWDCPTKITKELMIEFLGTDPWDKDISFWTNQNTHFFSRMLTFKLWMEDDRISKIIKNKE